VAALRSVSGQDTLTIIVLYLPNSPLFVIIFDNGILRQQNENEPKTYTNCNVINPNIIFSMLKLVDNWISKERRLCDLTT
jgi:hypothetical protein